MQVLEDDPQQMEAYQLLEQTLEQAPTITCIDLSDQNIDDDTLYHVTPQIAQYVNLEELNLSSNSFTSLPADLSGWSNVQNLNLSNIQITDFEAAVLSLKTMPKLKSLYINLFEET